MVLHNPFYRWLCYLCNTFIASIPGSSSHCKWRKLAEVTTQFVCLSISSPDLNLRSSSMPLTNSDGVGQEELYQSSRQAREIEVTLRRRVRIQKRIISVQVHGKPDCYKPYVWVDTTDRNDWHFTWMSTTMSLKLVCECSPYHNFFLSFLYFPFLRLNDCPLSVISEQGSVRKRAEKIGECERGGGALALGSTYLTGIQLHFAVFPIYWEPFHRLTFTFHGNKAYLFRLHCGWPVCAAGNVISFLWYT